MESKPELQRVLEARKREQIIKQRKEEDEARKKISPLEQELLKRKEKLEEVGEIINRSIQLYCYRKFYKGISHKLIE